MTSELKNQKQKQNSGKRRWIIFGVFVTALAAIFILSYFLDIQWGETGRQIFRHESLGNAADSAGGVRIDSIV